jgi:hypothetical protein
MPRQEGHAARPDLRHRDRIGRRAVGRGHLVLGRVLKERVKTGSTDDADLCRRWWLVHAQTLSVAWGTG